MVKQALRVIYIFQLSADMAIDSPVKRDRITAEPRSVEPTSHRLNLIALRDQLATLLSGKVMYFVWIKQCMQYIAEFTDALQKDYRRSKNYIKSKTHGRRFS